MGNPQDALTDNDHDLPPQTALSERMVGGVFWSGVDRFGHTGVQFVIQIVLARMLSPEAFGLVALVAVFNTVAKGVADAGFSQAVIQKRKLTQTDLSTVFFFNIALSVVMAGVIWAVAPWVARFYNQDSLTAILRATCFVVILDAFGRIHLSQLSKALQFKRLVKATLVPALVSGAAAIFLAYQGYGVWALVCQIVIQSGLYSMCLWLISPFRPSLVFSRSSLQSMFSYGSKIAVAGILNSVFRDIYTLVIGKAVGTVDLGYYNRAVAFKNVASTNLSGIIGRVTFPVYSAIQHDRERLARGFIRSISVLSVLSFSLMAMIAGIAEPLITTLLGEKWSTTATYLPLLCVVGAAYPIHAANLNLLKALGLSGLFLRLEVIKKCLVVLVLLVTSSHGILAIIYGQILTSLFGFWINAFYTRQHIGLSYVEQTKAMLPGMLAACAVLASTLPITWMSQPDAVKLGIALCSGLAAFLLVTCLFRVRFQQEQRLLVKYLPFLSRDSS